MNVTNIKVLGGGCKSCHALYENALQAVKQANLDIEVEYITDMAVIVSYGIMSTSALMINDEVVSGGKILQVQTILDMIQKS